MIYLDELQEQLKVLRLQLEQSRSQLQQSRSHTAEAQQEMAAVEMQWEAHNAHLQQELRLNNVADARAQLPAPPQRVYVQRRFRKLCGHPQTPEYPDVDDWAADIASHLKASLLSDHEGLNFVLDHLSGATGQEVRFRGPRTAEEALRIVQRVFGDVGTVGAAQEVLSSRQGESTAGRNPLKE